MMRIHRFTGLLLLAFSLLLLPSAGAAVGTATSASFDGPGPWMVRAWLGDESMLRAVASWGDHYRIDRKLGYLSIEADADRVAALLNLGFLVEVDEELTADIRHAEAAQRRAAERLAAGEEPEAGIPGYPCYRTVEESFATAAAIVAAHPDLASLVDIGDSWEKVTPGGNPGYDMLVLKLTNSAIPGPKPRFFLHGGIHAREYTTSELALRFAEQLVDGYGVDGDATWLLDQHEIHLLMYANPDGRKHAEAGESWRKNTNEAYCGATSSSRGADLNRNFEYLWNCCGGSSGSQCSETYRGPSPASEPEVQAIQNYLLSIFPDQRPDTFPGGAAPDDATGVYLDLHSYGELVLWPWGGTSTPSGNASAFTTLGRKFAYFNGHWPEQSYGLYATDGTTDDFGYGELGVASYAWELGTDFFQSCSVFESSILPGNLQALRYAAKVVRTPYLTPAGPDAVSIAANPASIAPGETVAVTATLDDTRYSNDNGTEPTQQIAAGQVFVDTPPWSIGATPFAMTPSDGTFNTSIEGATGTLDSAATAGLASGRHIVYVRGQDVLGNWGAPTATLLWVIDPLTAPVVQGVVRDAVTLAPLAAQVSVGPFSTATEPSTGVFSFQVPPGTYDIGASAAGHAATTLGAVTLSELETFTHTFDLQPITTLLGDDGEGGAGGWTAQSPWALTTSASHSPTHSWTDSPAGNYSNNVDTSLTSPVLDLSGATGVELSFWHRYQTEATYDFCRVEISINGGSSWSEVASYDGDLLSWQQVTLPLPQLDGVVAARLRFRLTTDISQVRDGWYVDDIALTGAVPANLVFADGFETGGTGNWSSTTP